jgi:20S proteasome alpha/beta subunit
MQIFSIRMIADLGNKMQVCTQRYGKRPYGVGLLVAGYDDQGPHIFQTCPSSNYYGEASVSDPYSFHTDPNPAF